MKPKPYGLVPRREGETNKAWLRRCANQSRMSKAAAKKAAKPAPKKKGRPPKSPNEKYIGRNLSITPEHDEWLGRDGNASFKARKAFDEAMEREIESSA